MTVVADYWGLLVHAEGNKLIELGRLASQPQQFQAAQSPEVGAIIGGNSHAGRFIVKGNSGVDAATVDKHGAQINGDLRVGGYVTAPIRLKGNGQQVDSIVLDGDRANVRLGGNNTAGGDIALFTKDATAKDLSSFDNATIQLDGNSGRLVLRTDKQERIRMDGRYADVLIGGNGQDGSIFLYSNTTSNIGDLGQAKIQLLAEETGVVVIKNSSLNEIIRIEASSSTPPPSTQPGDLGLVLDKGGRIAVKDWAGNDTVVLDGTLGDIALNNADCAEDFEVSTLDDVDPGTVVIIDQESRLRSSTAPYDKKVAGVISGAGNCKPGIILDKRRAQNNRMPVALVGKVYCKADAAYSPIEVGDLLTTSSTPGHAMKATEPRRAFGAVIGKALHPLKAGQGLIPILIALQ